MSHDERAAYRRQFVIAACNLRHMQMWWVPSERRILARAVAAERRFVIPEESVLIGVYAHPFNADDFVGDLDAMLAKLAMLRRR